MYKMCSRMFIGVLFAIAPNYPVPIKIGWITKVWYISKKKIYSEIWMSIIHNKDEFCKRYVGWKKPGTRDFIMSESIYMKFKNGQTYSTVLEARVAVTLRVESVMGR